MNGSTSVCADCGTHEANWASINRGVLLCNECGSVHRSLGRHVSHIRSLHSSNWAPVLKEMVFTLVNKGANTIWEQALHDPHIKVKLKKPNHRDKLHPTKHDFIVAKYKFLQLLPRPPQKDGANSLDDISKQLHASVRTGNLETCLRLLSLGANPNYVHPDRGNTPLHVAAQAGQAMQVELLVVHGANPCLLDRLGHTPEECARIAGHHQLADRLIECQFELTDKLSFFLCGRKPVHSIGEHFMVPQVAGSGLNLGLTDARSRLQELSNELFEELAADVYDEVDRRETDALWLMTQQLQSSVAFLPVNPSLSPLRNQGRQKLATLNAEEFAQLVVDILLDTKRRQTLSLETGERSGRVVPSTSEDQAAVYDPHDYDEVPMEESSLSPRAAPVSETATYSEVRDVEPPYAELKEAPKTRKGGGASKGETVSKAKFDLLKERLKKVQAEKEELEVANQKLQQNLDEMQKQLNKAITENAARHSRTSLQRSPSVTTPTSPEELRPHPQDDEPPDAPTDDYARVDLSKKTSRSSSTTEQPSSCTSPRQVTSPVTDIYALPMKKSSVSSGVMTPPPPGGKDTPLSDSAFEEVPEPHAGSPPVEDVHAHIKLITQCIQELLQAAQSHRQASFVPCSLKIVRAVDAMTKMFPAKPSYQEMVGSVREVTLAAQKLQSECRVSPNADLAFKTRLIINSAYDVAKAARHLVMCVEQEHSSSSSSSGGSSKPAT